MPQVAETETESDQEAAAGPSNRQGKSPRNLKKKKKSAEDSDLLMTLNKMVDSDQQHNVDVCIQ